MDFRKMSGRTGEGSPFPTPPSRTKSPSGALGGRQVKPQPEEPAKSFALDAIERQRRGRKRDLNTTAPVEPLKNRAIKKVDLLNRTSEFPKMFRSSSMPHKKKAAQKVLTGSDQPVGISGGQKRPRLEPNSPLTIRTAPLPVLQEPTLSPKSDQDKLNRTVTFSTQNSYYVEDESRKFPLIRNAMLQIAPGFRWRQLQELKDYSRQIVSFLTCELENRRVRVELHPNRTETWAQACSAIQKYEELYLV